METRHGRKARLITASQAAALVRPGDWIDYAAICSQPDAFDAALAQRVNELSDVSIRSCLAIRPRPSQETDPHGARIAWYNWHFSGYDRRHHDTGNCSYIPCNLGEISDYYRRNIDPVDIFVIKTRPADEHGNFNFGPNTLWFRDIAERAKTVIVEINPNVPHSNGRKNFLPAHAIDYVIEGDGEPMPTLPNPPPCEIDRAVARLVANEIEDGSCLQIGIGGMPNAVCALLLESGVKDLGVHTEMMTDGIIALYRAGRVTGVAKTLEPGKIVYTFALGAQFLYDTLDRNPDFLTLPLEDVNLPHIIMQNDRAVAINSTTQIDLYGQAASESDGHRHISGTGGQAQFVRGAYAAKGGKAFICLPSTYERRGIRKSRIVLELTPGNIVTTTRADMQYVVTEYGIANLKGRSVPERAKAIIALAHPDFRDDLESKARGAGLLPKHFR